MVLKKIHIQNFRSIACLISISGLSKPGSKHIDSVHSRYLCKVIYNGFFSAHKCFRRISWQPASKTVNKLSAI